ncbi:MAG: glycosyltransferase [Fibrobacterota bacterium]
MSEALLKKQRLGCSVSGIFGERQTVKKIPLRIVLVSDAGNQRNGVGTYYRDLAEHLADRVEKVKMLCPSEDGDNQYGGFSFPLPGDKTQRFQIPDYFKISREIKNFDPHIVIISTPGPFGLYGFVAAKRHKSAICIGYHTSFESLMSLYWKNIIGAAANGFMKILNRRLFRWGNVVVANNRNMVDYAARDGARRVCLMGTSISRDFLENPPDKSPERINRVVFAGRLAPEKNIPEILEAARKLPHIDFLIAGTGPLKYFVREAERELKNVYYAGWLSRKGLRELVDSCDMLVLPSKVESFGTTALEAMARKKLVLVSDSCGIASWPELSRGLFRMGNKEKLSESLKRLEKLTTDVLKVKSETARNAALSLNRETLEEWVSLFRDMAVSDKK